MELVTKYNIGDTVYSKTCPDFGIMEITKIIIENCDGIYKIKYYTIRKCNDSFCRLSEDDLTTENPNPKPKSVYDLEDGDGPFYVIDIGGYVYEDMSYNGDNDYTIVQQGNIFLSREEAEKEVKRRKIHQELKRLAGGYEFEPNGDNFYISYDYYLNDIDLGWTDIIKESGLVYFETEELAQNAIDEIGVGVLLRDYLGIEPDEK